MDKFGKASVGVCLIAALLVAPSAGLALEPGNDVGPYNNANGNGYYGNPTVFQSYSTGNFNFLGFESITTSSDRDYAILGCQGRPVKSVGIKDLTGDLDIQAFDLGGVLLGGSANGGTSPDAVNVTALNKHAIVLRVFGYGGATSGYTVIVTC